MADLPEGIGSSPDMVDLPPCTSSAASPEPAGTSTPSSTSPASDRSADSDMALLSKLKESNIEKLHTLCKMHLSFLLDLPGSSLEQFLGSNNTSSSSSSGSSSCGNSSSGSGYGSGLSGSGNSGSGNGERHRWFSSKRKKENKSSGKAVFGVPLTFDLLDCVQPLLDFLSQDQCLQQEGLFRKSGHIGRQRVLREHMESSLDMGVQVVEDELATGDYSPHDVASLLKSFLGEMTEPLLTEKHYVAHFQVPDMASCKQLQTVQLLLQLLPDENVALLRSLMELLHSVAAEEVNKMTALTLGTLFAPHILVPRKMTAMELHAVSSNIKQAVSFMIDHSTQIFNVPEALMRDISSYWAEHDMEGAGPGERQGRSCSVASEGVPVELIDSYTKPSALYRRRAQSDDIEVHTTVSFADRQASRVAASKTDTQVALAELYAHVSKMPESAKKRKILKQFTKANGMNSPSQEKHHKRSRSLGESLKKMMGRGHHRRQGSGHSIQLLTEASTPSSSLPVSTATPLTTSSQSSEQPATGANTIMHTPVIRARRKYETPQMLVGTGVLSGASASPLLNGLKQSLFEQRDILPSSPKVHIVDMGTHDIPRPTAKPSSGGGEPTLLSLNSFPNSPADNRENRGSSSPPPRTWFRTKSSQLRFRNKSASSPLAGSPQGKYDAQPSAFISPITRSMTKAPKSLQTHMMTPGSRKPMAMIQTP